MKIYNWKQLKELCGSQSYKLAKLEDQNGNSMTPYNKIKTPISKQFTIMQNRLRNEILPDGIYYVCLAYGINRSDNPDRFPIQKGKGNFTTPVHENGNGNRPFQLEKESILTSEKAVELLTQISDLKAEVATLKVEKLNLQQQLNEMSLEEEEGVGEEQNGMGKFLNENGPMLVGSISEWFKIKNRELDLKEKEMLGGKRKVVETAKRKFKTVTVTPGSKEHLALIDMYAKSNQDDKLEKEIEKLKGVNDEKYNELMNFYFEEEGEEEGNE